MTEVLSGAGGPILPPATLGLLGGGQLGRFFVAAAQLCGYRVVVLDPDPESPAGKMADVHVCADYQDPAALQIIVSRCCVATTEFENVPAETLRLIAQHMPVRPHADAVAVAQDRVREKQFFAHQGLSTVPFAVIGTEADVLQADDTLFPGILKTAHNGYDGKGQCVVSDRPAALLAWQQLGQMPCVLERCVVLDQEVSIMVARGVSGERVCYPVAENIHTNGILDVSIIPARIDLALQQQIQQAAMRIVTALDYVGVMGVEFFVSEGRLLVNEMAPRPHNSGHYTLDASLSSQFEQQVRAVCGLPLLATDPIVSSAVMVNVLGDAWFVDDDHMQEPDWSAILLNVHARLHLYGKISARRGRKMGHFTLLGEYDRVLEQANYLRRVFNPLCRDIS